MYSNSLQVLLISYQVVCSVFHQIQAISLCINEGAAGQLNLLLVPSTKVYLLPFINLQRFDMVVLILTQTMMCSL